MSMESYIERVRSMVAKNKNLWREMDRDRVVSYSYLQRFADGDYKNPGAMTLEKMEKYLLTKEGAV